MPQMDTDVPRDESTTPLNFVNSSEHRPLKFSSKALKGNAWKEAVQKLDLGIERKQLRVIKTFTQKQNENRLFITRSFNHRECCGFVAKDASNPNSNCCCGRTKTWHIEKRVAEMLGPWKYQTHSRKIPPSSFGEMAFVGFGSQTEKSPYIRVDVDTPIENLWKYMQDYWCLQKPKLVISITGGAKKFNMKTRLLTAFKRGIISAAYTTGAWIITGGTGNGVMKITGEAIAEHLLSTGSTQRGHIVALGIAAWGVVNGQRQLEGTEGVGSHTANYNLRLCKDTKMATLDHNHTNFILVDDGTFGQYGSEIPLRAGLEGFLSQLEMSDSLNTPVVMIVCEGGLNTLETAKSAIAKGIPSVIIKGSGRVADVIAKAFKAAKPRAGGDVSEFFDTFDDDFITMMGTQFQMNPVDEYERGTLQKCLQNLKELIGKRQMITVFDLDEGENNEMDRAILHALLKANKSDANTQINLALAWNRPDVAKTEIFTTDNLPNWKLITLEESMFFALVNDRHEFVQLFLDNGVQLSHFLTVKRLRNLYHESLEDSSNMSSILQQLLKHNTGRQFSLLMYSPRLDLMEANRMLLSSIGELLVDLLNDQYVNVYGEGKFEDPVENDAELEYPERDLFIWAILFNRKEVAMLFWRAGQDPIGGALIAARLLKRLSRKAEKQEEIELSQSLLAQSEMYEKLAIGVLSGCYANSREMAQQLLVREQKLWGQSTLFSMAAAAELMDFMQLSCCQSKLNKLWMGRIADHFTTWQLLGCMMFLPFVLPSMKFKSDQLEEKDVVSLDFSINRSFEAKNRIRTVAMQLRKPVKASQVSLPDAAIMFVTAPVIKFYYRVLSNITFLMLFTYVCLTKLPPIHDVSTEHVVQVEFILWIWSFSMVMEELRQIVRNQASGVVWKLYEHFRSFFNCLDVFSFILITVGIVLRFNGFHSSVSKIPYSLCLMVTYLRFMRVFYVSKTLGPKVIMIQKMIRDLVFFVSILVIFILSFGVAIQSLLHPDVTFSLQSMIEAVYSPYWQIFGELFLDRAEGKAPTSDACIPVNDYENETARLAYNADWDICPNQHSLVPLLSAIYMLLTNVLLINLLIAMFSFTFQTVQDNSEKIWRFNRYFVVHEYFEKPSLVPPFTLITNIGLVCVYGYRKMRKTYFSTNGFKVRLQPAVDTKLSALEKTAMEEFLIDKFKTETGDVSSRLSSAHQRLDQVIEELEQIRESLKESRQSSTVSKKL